MTLEGLISTTSVTTTIVDLIIFIHNFSAPYEEQTYGMVVVDWEKNKWSINLVAQKWS